MFERQPGLTPKFLYYFGFIVIAVFSVLLIRDLFLILSGKHLLFLQDPQTVLVRMLSSPFAVLFGLVFMNLFPDLKLDEEALSVRYFPGLVLRIPWDAVDAAAGPLDAMLFSNVVVLLLNSEKLDQNSLLRFLPKSHGSILQQDGPAVLVSGNMLSIIQVIERRVR